MLSIPFKCLWITGEHSLENEYYVSQTVRLYRRLLAIPATATIPIPNEITTKQEVV